MGARRKSLDLVDPVPGLGKNPFQDFWRMGKKNKKSLKTHGFFRVFGLFLVGLNVSLWSILNSSH